MSYPKTAAPFTGRGYVSPDGISFNITNQGTGVMLSFGNVPFVPAWATVGKEYAGINLQQDAQEYPGQTVMCVPDPDGNPEYLPACGSDTWDSVIAYGNEPGISSIFIPYNEFMLGANGCAFQTDGVPRQYYVELVTADGGTRTKFVFNFTTPTTPPFPGYPSSTPVPPPPEPVKGKGNKKNK